MVGKSSTSQRICRIDAAMNGKAKGSNDWKTEWASGASLPVPLLSQLRVMEGAYIKIIEVMHIPKLGNSPNLLITRL